VALAVGLACLAMFLPPMVDDTTAAPWRVVGVSLVLATALLLHWAFLAIAARRMERSVAAWVGLSVLLFPVGSAAALILLAWFNDERPSPTAAHG
jgi:hypothetical protein